MIEYWKPIPDFPGYDVSDRGRVRSYWQRIGLRHTRGTAMVAAETPQRILCPRSAKGYQEVQLCRESVKYHRRIHQLVLLAFVGPCPKGMQGCHEDGVRSNNWLINLRWDTCINNHQDRIKHGTNPAGEKHGEAKLTEEQVQQIRNMATLGDYSQRFLGKMFGVSQSLISHIHLRTAWTHLP
jgi:hypothetical protein